MKLYLVRHGDSSAASLDNIRPLSERGQQDIKRLAEFLAPRKIHLMQLFHSEKLRAKQTAEILLSACTLQTPQDVRTELDPLASLDPILSELKTWEGDTMLVGHMPFMGKLLSQLLLWREDQDCVIFKTGTIVCLESPDYEHWVIEWILTPELLQ